MNTMFNKSKLTTTMLLCGSLAITQALVGCTNKDDKKASKKTDTTSQTDSKNTPLDCNSSATTTGIQQYITKQIAQQANSTVQQLGQQAHINVQNVSMDSILAQLMVNVQSVKAVSGQADQCQAKVAVTLPANDIANANQMAASLNQPTLAQRLGSKGLTLDNNTIVADTATFKMPSNGGSFQVNSPSADAIISEVSNIMANSQLKQMMIQNNPTATSNATVANSTTISTTSTLSKGAVATGAAVAGATMAHHVNKHTATHGNSAHHEPSKRIVTKHTAERDSDDEPKKKPTQKLAESKTSIHKTTSETANTKTVITKTTTEKASTPTKVTTTHTTEKTITKPLAVPNDSTKLTIEQRNEKY